MKKLLTTLLLLIVSATLFGQETPREQHAYYLWKKGAQFGDTIFVEGMGNSALWNEAYQVIENGDLGGGTYSLAEIIDSGSTYLGDSVITVNKISVQGVLLGNSVHFEGGSGDLDGAGQLSASDRIPLNNHLKGTDRIYGLDSLITLDVNGDNQVDRLDYYIVSGLQGQQFPSESYDQVKDNLLYDVSRAAPGVVKSSILGEAPASNAVKFVADSSLSVMPFPGVVAGRFRFSSDFRKFVADYVSLFGATTYEIQYDTVSVPNILKAGNVLVSGGTGDLDDNGQIQSSDLIAFEELLDNIQSGYNPTLDEVFLADVNGNGIVDRNDLYILSELSGLGLSSPTYSTVRDRAKQQTETTYGTQKVNGELMFFSEALQADSIMAPKMTLTDQLFWSLGFADYGFVMDKTGFDQLNISSNIPAASTLNLEFDTILSTGVIRTDQGNSNDWDDAFDYSQVGHLPLTGGFVTGNVTLQDDIGLRLGSAADLRLQHNGANSYIDNHRGILLLRNLTAGASIGMAVDNNIGTNQTGLVIDGASSEVMVSIRHGGNQKLNTRADGVDITGDIYTSGSGNSSEWNTAYSAIQSGFVSSVAGRTGDVDLVVGDIANAESTANRLNNLNTPSSSTYPTTQAVAVGLSSKASNTALNDTAASLRAAIGEVGLQDVLEYNSRASFSNETDVDIKSNGKLTFGDADDVDTDTHITFIEIDEPNDVIQLKSESLILGTVVTGMNLSGDVQFNEDDTYIYFGSASVDGSFRLGVDSASGDFVIQAKESGVWVTKQNYTTP